MEWIPCARAKNTEREKKEKSKDSWRKEYCSNVLRLFLHRRMCVTQCPLLFLLFDGVCMCVCGSISLDRSLLLCIVLPPRVCMYLCYLSELLKPKHDQAMIKCLRINAKEMDWTMMMMMGACVEFVFVLCMRCDSVGFVCDAAQYNHIVYRVHCTTHSTRHIHSLVLVWIDKLLIASVWLCPFIASKTDCLVAHKGTII